MEAHTRLVQLKQHDEADMNRYRNNLDILLSAEKEALALIADIQAALGEHAARGEVLKAEAKEAQASFGRDVTNTTDSQEVPPQSDEPDQGIGKGKGKARENSPSGASDNSEDTEIPKNAAGEEHLHKRMALQQRLREAQIILHKVHFLKGDVRDFST